MRIWFQDCECSVAGTGVLAQTASLSSRNAVRPVYGIGKIGQFGQAPFGPLQSTFSLAFSPELDRDPNKATVNVLKELTGANIYSGVQIILGGLTGSECYMKSYSLDVEPNEPVKANAAYVTFLPTSGQSSAKPSTLSLNQKNAFAHGWTVFITNSGNALDTPTYSFSYNFEADWMPVYKIGQTKPSEVRLMSAFETLAFTRDVARHAIHSGENLSGLFTGTTTGDMRLMNIAFVCSDTVDDGTRATVRIPLSGFTIIAMDAQATLDDFLKTRVVATRGY